MKGDFMKEKSEFKVGDIVTLNSGGTSMTIIDGI